MKSLEKLCTYTSFMINMLLFPCKFLDCDNKTILFPKAISVDSSCALIWYVPKEKCQC